MRFKGISSKLAAAFLSSGLSANAAIAEPLWAHFLDTSQLSDSVRPDVEKTLDWLETYYGGFYEILWDLKDRQEDGTLQGKIIIKNDDDTYYTRATATVGLDYNPMPEADALRMASYYLGVDGKFYEFSLNETLVHELQHAAQENGTSAKKMIDAEDALREKTAEKLKPLIAYLEAQGIADPHKNGYDPNFDRKLCSAQDYLFFYDRQAFEKDACDKEIIENAEFLRLYGEWFAARMALETFNYVEENDAMDMADGLRGLLGKATRGHYLDTNLFYRALRERMADADAVYTASPEELLHAGPKTLFGPVQVDAYPVITGDFKITSVDVQQIQCGWTNQWNADTKNITFDGWKRINDFKMDFFKNHEFFGLTKSDRNSYEGALEKLVKRENEQGIETCPKPMP